jgi:GTP-binding protein HflX
VQRVLRDIGADRVPQVLVYNKVDKLDDDQQPRELQDVLELDAGVRMPRVFVSALTGQGLDELRSVISEAVAGTLATRLNLSGWAADELEDVDPRDLSAVDADQDF